MQNLDLFDFPEPSKPKPIRFPYPLARNSDPSTSYEAARDASFKASEHRVKALQAFFDFGPMTDFELADATRLQQNSIGKRRKDCQDAGLVDVLTNEDGVKVKRPAPSGSKALVWKLTQAGRDYVTNMD
jgi:hypothetical protein